MSQIVYTIEQIKPEFFELIEWIKHHSAERIASGTLHECKVEMRSAIFETSIPHLKAGYSVSVMPGHVPNWARTNVEAGKSDVVQIRYLHIGE